MLVQLTAATCRRSPDEGARIRSYDLYGVHLASAHAFVNPVPTSELPPGRAELVFRCASEPPDGVDWSAAETVDLQGERADGTPEFVFARVGGHDAVRIPGALDYYLSDREIVCHVLDDQHTYLVEIALLGMVLALWLERRGTPTLHASVVVIDGAAAGFLATSGGGKTTSLAACLSEGHALLTDDLLALRLTETDVLAERGYPALRLWPAQADRYLGAHEHLPVLHPDFSKRRAVVGTSGFGRFAGGATVLRRLYLPERVDDAGSGVELEPLQAQEAFMALVRNSFLPREVQLFGWQPGRLAPLARVASEVPVVRLRYPSGLDRLPDVIRQLQQEMRGDASPIS